MNPEEVQKIKDENKRKAELQALQPISFLELEKVFDKWMVMPDRQVLKLLMGYYCANKLPGKALWMFLIGPSGGGKTALLDSLLDLPDIFPISMLTPNTFLSGMPGRSDASLLPKLDKKIGLFKDWTSMLSMQKDAKAELMSQFREIHDGSMKKVFGNGAERDWKGKVSILAATTQAIDLNQQQYTHLGERFMNYRVKMPDRKEVAMRALNNSGKNDEMEKELRNAVYSFIKGIDFEKMMEEVTLPDKYKTALVDLANFCTMARSGIIRDFGMKKDVIFVPMAEMPTRIVGQLVKLFTGIVMANGGVIDDSVVEIIYKVALDSIPQTNKMVIEEMARGDDQTTAEIATALGYPTEPIRIYLENMALLRVCDRVKGAGNADRWKLKSEFAEIIRHYEGIEEFSDAEKAEREKEKVVEDEAEEDFKNNW